MNRVLRLWFLHLLALLARPFARRRPASITSVLYIKPDHLGDLLLATPVLAALRQRLPAARITALVGPWSRMVLARNPDVDALLACPFPGFERKQKAKGKRQKAKDGQRIFYLLPFAFCLPYVTLLRYALLLRAGRYDLAIVGRDDHWWGAALALLAGVPCRVGHAVPECRPFLTTALPWNPHDHVTAQGLQLVAAVQQGSRPGDQETRRPGGQKSEHTFHPANPPTPNPQPPTPNPYLPSPVSARFDPSEDDIRWAGEWMHAQGIGTHDQFVIIHPGTGGPAKLWFPERWAEVADALQVAGAHLALTGGPGEEALVADVTARMRTRALALAGRTSVGQLAALLRRAALVLGVDSGPLHLAAAQGVPTLHLYGPGDDGRFGPWGDPARHVVLREQLWCSPCGVFGACPRGLARPECMELISVTQVVERALRVLGSTSR